MTEQSSFVAYLRRERERRGISLRAVAQQTKISAATFAGLERGDLSAWPPGIYRRAFIRSYAEVLGLDPLTISREFDRLFPEDDGTDTWSALNAAIGDEVETPARSASAPHGDVVEPQLRLTFAGGSPTPWRDGASRRRRQPRRDQRQLAAAALEIAILLTIAASAGVVAGSRGFWMALALATVVYHVVGTVLFGSSTTLVLLTRPAAQEARWPAKRLRHGDSRISVLGLGADVSSSRRPERLP